MIGGNFSNKLAAASASPALQGTLQADAIRQPHFAPKAKHVIFLFLNGGMSQVDTFDPKPALTKYRWPADARAQRSYGPGERDTSCVRPWSSGAMASPGSKSARSFPRIAERIDDFCVIRSMHTDNGNHGPSLQVMNCGHQLPGRPSLGAWVTYGLGTENQNLPGFIVLCPGFPVLGSSLWSAGYMPDDLPGRAYPERGGRAGEADPAIFEIPT